MIEDIEAYNLEKKRGKREVLKGVSFTIKPSEIVGLLGSNGCGKTTLISLIAGVLPIGKGSILFKGEDISFFPIYKRAQMGISYLPQESSIFRNLTVEENLESVLEWRTDLDLNQKREKKESIIEELELGNFLFQKGNTLSGGQRRRVEVARSLMRDPLFFLLDEPFSGIDPKTIQEISKILIRLKDKGIGILITDHNVKDLLPLVDRAYILHEGEILAEGSKDSILKDTKVKDFYLGDNFRI